MRDVREKEQIKEQGKKTIDVLEDLGIIALYGFDNANTLYMVGVDAPSFVMAARKLRSAYMTLLEYDADQEALGGITLSAPVEVYKVIHLDAETLQTAHEDISEGLWTLIAKEQVFFSSYVDFENMTGGLFSRVSVFLPDANLKVVYAHGGYTVFEFSIVGGPDFRIRGVVTSDGLSNVIVLDKASLKALEEEASKEA